MQYYPIYTIFNSLPYIYIESYYYSEDLSEQVRSEDIIRN